MGVLGRVVKLDQLTPWLSVGQWFFVKAMAHLTPIAKTN
jgi:hypothetical protein